MAPPTIVTPTTILSFFIIFLLRNSALSGGVSVGGEEGEGGDPSDVKGCDGAKPSGIEWCEGTDTSDADECGVDSDSSEYDDNDNGWCEGVNLFCGE